MYDSHLWSTYRDTLMIILSWDIMEFNYNGFNFEWLFFMWFTKKKKLDIHFSLPLANDEELVVTLEVIYC